MQVKETEKGISVIICCYNSATRLYETLKHLTLQKTNAALFWEIIVVDNASTDNTASAAFETWKGFGKNNTKLTVVEEKKQGLSFARKKGVDTAQYEIIVFCDDDNWFNENYLQTAYNIITGNKNIGALGGQSAGISDTDLPDWFSECGEYYAACKQAPATGIINYKGYVFGAGMVSRKKLFQSLINDNFPGILSDRKGNTLSAGGDCEYCQRLILQGYDIYYSEELFFHHYIPPYRLTEEYRLAMSEGLIESRSVIGEYLEAVRIKQLSRYQKLVLLTYALKDILKSVIRRRQAQPTSKKLLYYLFNIGFDDRKDLKIIRQFYISKPALNN